MFHLLHFSSHHPLSEVLYLCFVILLHRHDCFTVIFNFMICYLATFLVHILYLLVNFATLLHIFPHSMLVSMLCSSHFYYSSLHHLDFPWLNICRRFRVGVLDSPQSLEPCFIRLSVPKDPQIGANPATVVLKMIRHNGKKKKIFPLNMFTRGRFNNCVLLLLLIINMSLVNIRSKGKVLLL